MKRILLLVLVGMLCMNFILVAEEKTGLLNTHVVTQIGLVVKDIEKSSKVYADFLGVEPPEIKITDPEEKAHTKYRGKPTKARAKLAFFRLENITIELIEPIGGPSTWREFLEKNGEGVHHIAFRVGNMKEKVMLLEKHGMSEVQRGDFTGGAYSYIDSEKQLAVLLELLVQHKK